MANIQKQCPRCHTIYIGDGYKHHCTKECYGKLVYEKQRGLKECKKKTIYERICLTCNESFLTNRKNTHSCSFGCQNANRPDRNAQAKIAKANARWLEDNKPKTKGKSFDQLNKAAEWKRVWDDRSWQRQFQYVRG